MLKLLVLGLDLVRAAGPFFSRRYPFGGERNGPKTKARSLKAHSGCRLKAELRQTAVEFSTVFGVFCG